MKLTLREAAIAVVAAARYNWNHSIASLDPSHIKNLEEAYAAEPRKSPALDVIDTMISEAREQPHAQTWGEEMGIGLRVAILEQVRERLKSESA